MGLSLVLGFLSSPPVTPPSLAAARAHSSNMLTSNLLNSLATKAVLPQIWQLERGLAVRGFGSVKVPVGIQHVCLPALCYLCGRLSLKLEVCPEDSAGTGSLVGLRFAASSDLRPPKHKATRTNNTTPSDRLRILNSPRHIVLLCRSCYKLVESAILCSYRLTRLGDFASVHQCHSCCRQVHSDCVSRYSSFAPFSYLSSAADLGSSGFSIWINCWVPRLVDSKLRGCGCLLGFSWFSAAHERLKWQTEIGGVKIKHCFGLWVVPGMPAPEVPIETLIIDPHVSESNKTYPEKLAPTISSPIYYDLGSLFYHRFWGLVGDEAVNFVLNWWDGRASIAGIAKKACFDFEELPTALVAGSLFMKDEVCFEALRWFSSLHPGFGESGRDRPLQCLFESLDPSVNGCTSKQRRMKGGWAEASYALGKILSFKSFDDYLIFQIPCLYSNVLCNHQSFNA